MDPPSPSPPPRNLGPLLQNSPSTLLLLPDSSDPVVAPQWTISQLPPILPPIQGPRTPQTPRRIPIITLLGTPRTPVRHTTKKKGKKEATRDQRLIANALRNYAGMNYKSIMAATGLTRNQYYYAIHHRITPQRQKRGRNPMLNSQQQQQLIQWVSLNRENRRTPWAFIPSILGWDCSVYAIATAFRLQGYGRFLAR